MSIYKVSLAFATWTDAELDAFTEGVVVGMTGNASYLTPPVTPAALTASDTTFKNAMAAMITGGQMQTSLKNVARAALLALLRQLAMYVQATANNNLAVLQSSGFSANSTSHTQSPLVQPIIVGIVNEMSTQLVVRVTPIRNARSYAGRIQANGGPWVSIDESTQAKRYVINGLVSGTFYTIQIRAVGGSTGFSDWSDPVTHIAT